MLFMQALAQDQLRALRQMCAAAFGDDAPHVEVYDGDTGRVRPQNSPERGLQVCEKPLGKSNCIICPTSVCLSVCCLFVGLPACLL